MHFALLPFSVSANWPPLFFSLLAFCTSLTSLNPVLNLYFDPSLRLVAKGYFLGRKKERKIGSIVSPASSGETQTRSGGGGNQLQLASRVSHFELGTQRGEAERREADAESRAALKQQLFGKGATEQNGEEGRALELGKELVLEIERDMVRKPPFRFHDPPAAR